MSTPPSLTGPAVPSLGAAPAAALPEPRLDAARPQPPVRWQERYAALVRAADLTALAGTVAMGTVFAVRVVGLPGPAAVAGGAAALLAAVIALGVGRVWEPVVLGSGTTEYRRLGWAVAGAAVALTLTGLALQVDDVVRPWVFVVLPAFALIAGTGRHLLRRWLHAQRRQQRFQLPVLAVGSHQAVAELIARTRRDPHFGWTVTGACTSTGAGPDGAPDIDGVPVVGDLAAVPAAVRRTGYRVVAVSPGPGWGPRRLHELAWQLEGSRTELAVDPGLLEVGPRLHLTPVDGMPLVELTRPRLTGTRRLLKDVVDVAGASVLLMLLAPALLLVALAVKAGGGSVLDREARVGEGGRTFGMSRFRTTDADGRPTAVGRLLRRTGIAELPQLLDVLGGSMSLVGPRPPRPEEMTGTDAESRRRLLVRPGMTGLGQVLPGRDGRTADEWVRLDLRYVENWSLTLDLTIMLRAAGSVLRRQHREKQRA